MNNPAFIVDGFTEKLILREICPGKPVRRIDLNGKSVTIQAMANKIASLIRLFNNKYYPIIVIVDREERSNNSDEIKRKLRDELDARGLQDQDIRISVADRMFENWIAADWGNLNMDKAKPAEIEGKKGVSILKKYLGRYNKTTDGVMLFLSSNPKIMYENSASFQKLVDDIKDVNCPFLRPV